MYENFPEKSSIFIDETDIEDEVLEKYSLIDRLNLLYCIQSVKLQTC